jgi:hypothetical protein
MKHWTTAFLFLALALGLLGGSCEGNPAYSDECRELADDLAERIDAIATNFDACEEDGDCTYAAVVVPCDRDNVRNAVINQADIDPFREAIKLLSESKCDAGNIDDCNTQCGTSGSLIFGTTGAACDVGVCVAVEEDDYSHSLASSELCDPQKFVYLPEDLDVGLP